MILDVENWLRKSDDQFEINKELIFEQKSTPSLLFIPNEKGTS
jgi:hypothetical protein